MTRTRTQRKPRAPRTRNTSKSIVAVGPMDTTIALVVGILVLIGVVAIFTSSHALAARLERFNEDPFHFLRLTLIWAALGFVAMFALSNFNYQIIRIAAYPIFLVALILLIMVMGVGIATNGAQRWLNLFGIQFQPSEAAKAALIFALARVLSDYSTFFNKWKGFFISCAAVGATAGLVAFGSFSSSLIIAAIGFGIIFVASPHIWRFVLAGLAAAGAFAAFLVFGEPFRIARVAAWRDPWAYARHGGYQIINSLYAIASGGLFGLGIAQSRQVSFIPEPYNDMIFAIIVEEFGFMGAALVIVLFAIFIWRGIRVAMNAPDTFSSLTAMGIVFAIAVQTFINIAVVTNSIPNTGVTLPFISYGGTSLLVKMSMVGVLLNISRYSKVQ